MRYLLTLFLFSSFFLHSQKEFNNWHFGTGAALDFNGGNPVYVSGSAISTSEGSASVSDCEGNLLFYTDGATVYNRNNAIMVNGTGLFGTNQGGTFSYPPTQAALIVKRPESSGIYYIFTSSPDKGVNYTMVNMNLNGGLGQVLSGFKNVNLSSKATEKLAVTYHANGEDIWVVTHYGNSNEYEAFLVTKTGVQSTGVSSSNGGIHGGTHGDLKISPNGKKIAAVLDFQGEVFLGDFNNATGYVTNTASVSSYSDPHGVDFSPDNTKMYINDNVSGIVQFNVNAGSNSQILNAATNISNSGIYGSMQLAPNGKIYVANAYSSYLGIINSPNSSGPACNFVESGIYIGESSSGYEVTNVTLTSLDSYNGPNSVTYSNSCAGDTVHFTLAVTDDISSIQWDFGDPVSGIFNSSIQYNPSHFFTSSGNYTVTVIINYLCGSETIIIPVTIGQTPSLGMQDSIIVCSGVPTVIGITPEANTTYDWTPTTGLSNSAISNPTLTLNSVAEKNYFNYSLHAVNNSNGCEITEPVVIELTNPIVDAGPDQDLCSGDTVDIGAAAKIGYQYLWTPSTGITDVNASLTKATLKNTGVADIVQSYTLTATLDGCQSSDNLNINLKGLTMLSPAMDTTICSLDTIQLNPTGNAGATYLWSSSFGLSSVTAVSPFFSVSNKTTAVAQYVKVAQITNDGCANLDTVIINVYPQAGIDNYQYLCPGFGVALTPYGQGVNFVWSPNENIDNVNASNPVVNPDSSKTYYLTVTDVFGCTYEDSVWVDVNPVVPIELGADKEICRGDTILLGGTGSPKNAIFSWSPKLFLSHPDSNYTFAYPDSSKLYILTSQSDTCTGKDTILLTVNQLPNVQLLPATASICFRDSLILNVTGALNYQWFPGTNIIVNDDSAIIFLNDTAVYWVVGTDAKGCVKSDTAEIAVRPLPEINLKSDTSVCFTDSIQVVAQGGGSYQWSPTEWVSDETLANPFLIPLRDTIFVVEVTGVNACKNKDSINVNVNPLPVIGLMSDTIICSGTMAYLWARGGTKYQWSPSTFLSNPNIANPISTTNQAISYQVIVTDINNCVDSAQTNISINVTPEASFTYTYEASCSGYDVAFKNQSNNEDAYFWNFGDGKTSVDENPSHTYQFGTNTGTYLVVGNNNICFDTATVNFDWKKLENYITISTTNVLTPNNDNLNDCFEVDVEGNFDACTKIEFFDRWGLKVYDSEEFSNCFRGVNEYNFQNLSEGTYFYVISINDYVKNGFVTIVK